MPATFTNSRCTIPSFQRGIAHICVVDPLGKRINSKEGWWANLFATHPPMKNRIMLLNAMAYETLAVTEHHP